MADIIGPLGWHYPVLNMVIVQLTVLRTNMKQKQLARQARRQKTQNTQINRTTNGWNITEYTS